MAIRVLVSDYCHNCSEFEADVDKQTLYNDLIHKDITSVLNNTTIRCLHRQRCYEICKHIEKELERG